jgi:hypothetical protein
MDAPGFVHAVRSSKSSDTQFIRQTLTLGTFKVSTVKDPRDYRWDAGPIFDYGALQYLCQFVICSWVGRGRAAVAPECHLRPAGLQFAPASLTNHESSADCDHIQDKR